MSYSISAVTGVTAVCVVRRTSRPGSRGRHPDDGLRGAMDSVHFIGTATTVIRLGAFTVLTDPNFLHRGQRAYLGKGLWSRRLTEPRSLRPTCRPSTRSCSHTSTETTSTASPGAARPDAAGRHDEARRPPAAAARLHDDRPAGLAASPPDAWGGVVGDRGAPGRPCPRTHRALLPPVMGSLLTHTRDGVVRRVHVSGDTLTGDHLTRIHARHPDIDVGIVHLGGTRVLWHTVTMDDVMGVEWVRTIEPRHVVAVHHDDYRVFRSPVADFVDRLAAVDSPVRLTVPGRGDLVALADRDQ